MNQRHKDIIKRLRAYSNPCSSVDVKEIIPKRDFVVEILDYEGLVPFVKDRFDLADLLAIVRNVDIEEQEV